MDPVVPSLQDAKLLPVLRVVYLPGVHQLQELSVALLVLGLLLYAKLLHLGVVLCRELLPLLGQPRLKL
jgi:hypothetical protein